MQNLIQVFEGSETVTIEQVLKIIETSPDTIDGFPVHDGNKVFCSWLGFSTLR